MKQRINIAKILKECPSGMELDCTMIENVYFDTVLTTSIKCYYIKNDNNKTKNTVYFNKFGEYLSIDNAKCVIFPKGKTTWEGFHRPFKDGDIIFTHADCTRIGLGNTWISIFEENRNGGVATYVDYCNEGKDFYTYLDDKGLLCMKEDIIHQRLATEEEKQRLFQAIEDNGYKWNPESKILEKLTKPEFKVGDEIVKRNSISNSWIVYSVSSEYYGLKSPNGSENIGVLPIEEQDDWELVPNKFDINTLKPFESRVLVRAANRKWVTAFYSHYDKDSSLHYCVVGGLWYEQCIPYEGNEHLLNTTDDCDNFYKTWEK